MKIFDGGWVKILYLASGLTKKPNKAWEFQVSWISTLSKELCFRIDWWDYPTLEINLFGVFKLQVYNSKEQDHAGFNFNLKILGLDIAYKYYDIRHWDYENDKWEKYE